MTILLTCFLAGWIMWRGSAFLYWLSRSQPDNHQVLISTATCSISTSTIKVIRIRRLVEDSIYHNSEHYEYMSFCLSGFFKCYTWKFLIYLEILIHLKTHFPCQEHPSEAPGKKQFCHGRKNQNLYTQSGILGIYRKQGGVSKGWCQSAGNYSLSRVQNTQQTSQVPRLCKFL